MLAFTKSKIGRDYLTGGSGGNFCAHCPEGHTHREVSFFDMLKMSARVESDRSLRIELSAKAH